jgi:hypothetical protein
MLDADVAAWVAKVTERKRRIFLGSVADVKGSVQHGSPVTAAPGQPVDTGALINSWQDTYPDEWTAEVATAMEYAEAIEDGQQAPYTTASGKAVTPKPITFRSSVGGAHSVALTRAGWPALGDAVVVRVVNE